MAYSFEEEQEINELKAWWQENYKSIIVIFVFTFSGVFGWRYWQEHQVAKSKEISAQYDQLIYNRSQDQNTQNVPLEQFVKDNGKTSYAVFALLDGAKVAVDGQNFTQAEQLLQQAIAQSTDEILTSIGAIRLATIQYQLQKFDDALVSLNQVKGQSWNSHKLLLTGDIQLAKGDKMAAKASFEQALHSTNPLQQSLVQVRLNNL